jgi:hypothetical protein
MEEETAMGRFGGPPINRAARGGVDPIPLSSSSRRSHFHRCRSPAVVALLGLSCSRARTHPASSSGQARASTAAPRRAPLAHAR